MGQLWEGKIAFKISKKSWKNKPSCSSKNSTHCIKFSQKTEFPKICIYIWCSLARFRKNSITIFPNLEFIFELYKDNNCLSYSKINSRIGNIVIELLIIQNMKINNFGTLLRTIYLI